MFMLSQFLFITSNKFFEIKLKIVNNPKGYHNRPQLPYNRF